MATSRKPKATTSGDDRLARSSQGADPERTERGATADETRTDTDGLAMTKAERMQMIKDEFRQEALPSVPAMVGWHVCWLSSNSQWDPLSKRERLGYVPVKVHELRGFKIDRMATGADDLVRCNEMILYKIEQEIYDMIMQEFHHDQPEREEESLKARLSMGNQDSSGKELGVIEGFEDLAVKRPVPRFA